MPDERNRQAGNRTSLGGSGGSGAPLNSPAFTGTPTAPTAAAGTNTTQLATTAFVSAAVAAGNTGSFNKPTGVKGESHRRALNTGEGNAPTSGVLWLTAIDEVPAGTSLSTVSWAPAGAPTVTHWWFCLYDANLNLLGVTADQLTASTGGPALVTLSLTGSIVTPTNLIYAGCVFVFSGWGTGLDGTPLARTSLIAAAPTLGGGSTSGLTTPGTAPSVAAAITASTVNFYAAVG